jgi:hypothetical protein
MKKAKVNIKKMLALDLELKLLFSKAASITSSLVRLVRYPKVKNQSQKLKTPLYVSQKF